MRPNVELNGRRRRGALAVRRMIGLCGARPGRHAVGGPFERQVRRSASEGTAGTNWGESGVEPAREQGTRWLCGPRLWKQAGNER